MSIISRFSLFSLFLFAGIHVAEAFRNCENFAYRTEQNDFDQTIDNKKDSTSTLTVVDSQKALQALILDKDFLKDNIAMQPLKELLETENKETPWQNKK